MILLADSGSTKTIWKTIRSTNIQTFTTSGLNPYLITEQEVSRSLESFAPFLEHELKAVYFYGAGCGSASQNSIIEAPLKNLFPNAKIHIYNDLLAVARSVFQQQEGIACILGTGSNATYYNGEECINTTPSLGYVLGDEGSGSFIGKQLLKSYYYKEFTASTQSLLDGYLKAPLIEVLEQVYQKGAPNRYLGSFVKIIRANLHVQELQYIVEQALNEFFRIFIQPYPEHLSLAFTGGIAYNFQELLYKVAQRYNRTILSVTNQPLDGLIQYHSTTHF